MIVIFHCLYVLVHYCLKIIKKRKCLNDFIALQSIHDKTNLEFCETVDAEENLRFDPPVYKQRYGAVQEILLENKWKASVKRIVDFGCAEFGLFMFIKRLCRIQEILEVDIDEELLKENLCKIQPLTIDYISKRTEPLIVQVLLGSISDPDRRLLGTDVVIGIEIIEHLFPDTLDALPYNIFGFIKPKIAIFTTPNADFNVLFPNFRGFRHDDHKFEWSRQQFQSWATHVISRFPDYSVYFKGIGEGPKGTEHLGCCSQMAVFVKENALETVQTIMHMEGSKELTNNCTCNKCIPHASFGVCTYHSSTTIVSELNNSLSIPSFAKDVDDYYKVVKIVEYPYDVDERSPEQKILDELKYRMCLMGNINGRFYNDECNRCEIPLIELVFNQFTHFTTVYEAREILLTAGFKIEECMICGESELCVIYEPEMESHSSTPSSRSIDGFNTDRENSEWSTVNTEGESDWEVNSDIQRGIWLDDLSNPILHVPRAETIENVHEIVNNLITNAEQSISTRTQNVLEMPQISDLKEANVPNDDEEGKCSHSDNCNEPSNVMYDSGYYKSNTNLTTSTQSGSELLDGDILDDQLINHTHLEEIQAITDIINISTNKENYGEIPLDSRVKDEEHKTDVVDVTKETLLRNIPITPKSLKISCMNVCNDASSGKSLFIAKSMTGNLESKLNITPNGSSNKTHLKDNIREPVPGTSNMKKKKKAKRFDDDDDSIVDVPRNDRLLEINEEIAPEVIELVQVAEPVVENGDLANNNRDLEGNNYPNAQPNGLLNDGNDNENVVLQNNIHAEEQINEDVENRNAEVEEEEVNNGHEIAEIYSDDGQAVSDFELQFASREALYDPNSQMDMLEEFSIPSIDEAQSVLDAPVENVVIIGININPSASDAGPVLPVNADPFPNWLLHLLGADVAEDGEAHVEPHFYCQGDGVGVHPSFIEEEDFEEEQSSSGSESTTSGTTNDDAQAEPTVSEVDVGSLPDDSNHVEVESNASAATAPATESTTQPENLEAAVQEIASSSSGAESADEFYDTQDDTATSNRSEKSPNTIEVKNKNV